MTDYDRLVEDIALYLTEKLPTEDNAAKMEVSEYIGNRVSRFIQSALIERDREWQRSLKSQQRHFDHELDRLRRRYRGERNG